MKRIAVGMSGGTDSAAAALLLKRAGMTPVGVTLLLSGNEDVSGAEAICKSLGHGKSSFQSKKSCKFIRIGIKLSQ